MTWAEVPPLDVPERSRIHVLVRLTGAATAAVVLWLVGLHAVAIIAIAAGVVLAGVSLLRPSAGAWVERLFVRVGTVVGHVLSVVLLTVVHVLVFWPVSLVLRVVGHDPLGPGVGPDDPTFWHLRQGRPLPRRQYADERSLWARSGVSTRRRSRVEVVTIAAGVVVLLLALDLAAGMAYDGVRDATHEESAGAAVPGQTFEPSEQPAFRDMPFAPQLIDEQLHLPSVPDTFLRYRLVDFDGVYTKVRDGVRLSYQAETDGRPVRILFFGGSAMFGSGQRDEHTIASEVARLAEADGIAVEPVNYGRPGYMNWPELELFEQVASDRISGDIVVFYDGFNDLQLQMNEGRFTRPTDAFEALAPDQGGAPVASSARRVPAAVPGDADTGWDDIAGAYWDQSGTHRLVDDVSALIGGGGDDRPPPVRFAVTREESETSTERRAQGAVIPIAAQHAVRLVTRGVELADHIARGYHMQPFFFWQPFLYSKRIAVGEEQLKQFVPYEPERWIPAVAEVRRRLRAPIIDLSEALDASDQPVMWDFVHTNELGAKLVAEAMYRELKPAIERAARAASLRASSEPSP